MKEQTLKHVVAAIILTSHGATFISLIVLTMLGGFDPEQMKTVAGFILPMFAVYTATIVKSAVAERHETGASTRRVSRQFASITLSFTLLFSLMIPILVFCKAFNVISDFGVFKLFLTFTETAFAVYLAMIIDALYKREAHQQEGRAHTES